MTRNYSRAIVVSDHCHIDSPISQNRPAEKQGTAFPEPVGAKSIYRVTPPKVPNIRRASGPAVFDGAGIAAGDGA